MLYTVCMCPSFRVTRSWTWLWQRSWERCMEWKPPSVPLLARWNMTTSSNGEGCRISGVHYGIRSECSLLWWKKEEYAAILPPPTHTHTHTQGRVFLTALPLYQLTRAHWWSSSPAIKSPHCTHVCYCRYKSPETKILNLRWVREQ